MMPSSTGWMLIVSAVCPPDMAPLRVAICTAMLSCCPTTCACMFPRLNSAMRASAMSLGLIFPWKIRLSMFSIIIRFTSDDDMSSHSISKNIYVMKRFWFKTLLAILTVMGLWVGTFLTSEQQRVRAQEASTPTGIFVTVTYTDPINVRGGPSTVYYPIIGQLTPGDVVPALGVSPGREWVQITYPPTGGRICNLDPLPSGRNTERRNHIPRRQLPNDRIIDRAGPTANVDRIRVRNRDKNTGRGGCL